MEDSPVIRHMHPSSPARRWGRCSQNMALGGGALCPPGVPEAAGRRRSLGTLAAAYPAPGDLPVPCCWGIRLWLVCTSLWGFQSTRGLVATRGPLTGAPFLGLHCKGLMGGEGVPAPLHGSCVVQASLGLSGGGGMP